MVRHADAVPGGFSLPEPLDGELGASLPANAAFVISVAARLVGVHEQTLRYYERAGLLEPAQGLALRALGLSPLLDVGMRLGEGSGAMLAVPLVRAAQALLAQMGTLEDLNLGGAPDGVSGGAVDRAGISAVDGAAPGGPS